MSGSYIILAPMSSIVGVLRSFTVRACRPEQICWLLVVFEFVVGCVYAVYVYGTPVFFGVRGGFVDRRRRRQHEYPRRPAALWGRRHIRPHPASGLHQLFE